MSGGGNLVPAFQFVALFFACALEHCALSEYPKKRRLLQRHFGKTAPFLGGVTQKNGKTCPQSNRGFWRCQGGNLVPAFQFVALSFACAREDCALPEYPGGVNWYNDIFKIWARFWP